MADFIDCKYEENLVFRLEQISQEFISTPIDDTTEENIILLNYNTKILNRKLRNFRILRSELVKSNKITPALKRKIRDQFVPEGIFEIYDNADISSVKALIDFTRLNSDFFRKKFPNENRLIEIVSELDPIAFKTFSSEFPNIDTRLQSGPISPAEVNSLIRENNLDPNRFASQLQSNRKGIFNLLEQFLSALGIGISIMGSFCALVEDVFALSRGQRDLSGNSATFLNNFKNVLGLINPSAAQVISQIEELIFLIQSAQQNSINIATNLQNAFGILAAAFGIAINFVDIFEKAKGETEDTGSIDVNWDFIAIRDAISANNTLFLEIVDKTNKPLGDINQDGIVNNNDATSLQTYIDNTSTQSVTEYINNIMIPFLNANSKTYSQFIDFPSAKEPGSSMGDLLGDFSSVAEKFGAGAGSGDFGLGNIIQIITLGTGIISSIQALVSGSRPVNIQGLFQQLDQIVELASAANKNIANDFQEFSKDYQETVEDALKEAEDNSVDNPARTAEISQKNQESLKENYTKALEATGESSKTLGPRLIETVNKIRNGIRQLAAVGVLENLDQQLSQVIDQSSSQLKSRIGLFTTESLNNGYHFNMGSSYSKMSDQISLAQNAASAETTDSMKKSVNGMIAQSSEKFRQKNKEEVEFVALRFCKLAGEIERLYKNVTQPLEQMTGSFNSINPSLSAAGNETTLRAIRAGAIRYDTQTRLQAIQQSGGINATITSPYINNAGERSIVPEQGTIPRSSSPLMSSDYAGLPTYNEVFGRTWQGLIRYEPGDRSQASNAGNLAGGWDGLERDTLAKFVKLARRWGSLLRVASARRPRNDRGFHQAGKALDIYLPHNQHVRFLNMAFEEEFRGFGTYGAEVGGPFVHIDTRGANRSWTGSGGRFNYYNLRGPSGAKIG
jgi:hypothetical protein